MTDMIPGPLDMGGTPLGNLFARIPGDVATATTQAASECSVRHYDTALHCGAGLSELRVGLVLRQKPRDRFAISTKVGR